MTPQRYFGLKKFIASNDAK